MDTYKLRNLDNGFKHRDSVNEIAKGNVDNMTPEEVYKILESIPNFVTSNRDDVKVLKEFMQQQIEQLNKYQTNLEPFQQQMDKKLLNQYKRLNEFKNQTNGMLKKLQGINQELDVILNKVNKLLSEHGYQNEVVE